VKPLKHCQYVKNHYLKFIFTTIPQQYSPNLLCSRHFTEDCFFNLNAFNEGFASPLLLKDGSVPSLFGPASSSSELQPVSIIDICCCYVLCSMHNMYLVVYVAQLVGLRLTGYCNSNMCLLSIV